MKRILCFVPFAAAACALHRAGPQKHVAERLVDTALESGQAYALLGDLVTAAPHRLSGSKGAADAVAWGRDAMQRIGLENVRLEPVMVPHWVRGPTEEVTLLDTDGPVRLPALALGGSVATPEAGIAGEVIVVRSWQELDGIGEAVKGKIVLFNRPMPRALRNTFSAYRASVPQRTSGASRAARLGAVAALVRSMTTRLDDVPHTGAMRYTDGVARIPAAAISTKAATRLARLVKEGRKPRVRIRLSCRTLPDVASANVVGEITGSERPNEIVVIGGHLDCWDVGQGAHDDGAGIVHCLEAARLIKTLGTRPKRTIRVVFFMNEENGLRGGRAYAAAHRSETHVAAIESDRGGFEPRGFTCSAKGARFSALEKLAAPLDRFDIGSFIPGGGGADIGPLAEQGVPLFGLLPAWHRYFDYHHSERDRLENVNPRELQLGAAAVAYLAWALANE